jgi:hypothetical protein
MKSLSNLLLIPVLTSSIAVGGCEVLKLFSSSTEVYVPNNAVAELRGPHKVKVWTRDRDGVVRKGYVMAHDRWLIGPPASVIPESAKPTVKPENSTFDQEASPKMLAEIDHDCLGK